MFVDKPTWGVSRGATPDDEITESALSARDRSKGLQRIRSFSVGEGGVGGGLGPTGVGLHAPWGLQIRAFFSECFQCRDLRVICSDLHGNFHMNRGSPKE